MWPFKKRIDPVSVRISAHASDIAVLYSRLYQLERYLQYELMDRISKIDKSVKDLEKLLKNSDVHITIVEK